MVLNSISYLLFLVITFLLFLVVPKRYRWVVLLIASVLFYSFLKKLELIITLLIVILMAFSFGRQLAKKTISPKNRTNLLIIAILLILSPLFFLRYLIVLVRTIVPFWPDAGIITPFLQSLSTIGISFFIFQAISYLIDIYLEIITPESHLGHFALSLSFFPKILQGPIERSGNLLPQLNDNWEIDYQNIRLGLLKIGKGLLLKVLIADRLALVIDPIFNNIQSYSGLPLIFTVYLYSFQIYLDFLAYTEIALGSAKCFNINLTNNFNKPYLAISIADFWRRWHITFSKWILDYIFKPLQMKWRNHRYLGVFAALLITFIISGIWHGPKWTFLVWGLLHGFYLVIENLLSPIEKKAIKKYSLGKSQIIKILRVIVTFNLVSFAWIFFRSNSIKDALYIISHLFVNLPSQLVKLNLSTISIPLIKELIHPLLLGQGVLQIVAIIIMLVVFSIYSIWEDPKLEKGISYIRSNLLRWSIYYALIIITLIFGIYNPSQFIYFNF